MPYCVYNDIYDYSGLSNELIQSVTGKSSAQVETMLDSFIAKADQRVQKWVHLPIVIQRERHVADGEQRIFELGPEDTELELYSYNPQEGVSKRSGKGPVFAVYEGSHRTKKPYPKDCDSCENNAATDFASSNAAPTATANTVVSLNVGDYYLSTVYTADQYLQYGAKLNKNIHIYDYFSIIIECNTAGVTFTFRIYDKDDNSNYVTFTLPTTATRFFVHIKIDEMTGSVDWEDTPMYYWRLYADAGCTCKVDGGAFNDGYIWTFPYGELIHSACETTSTREGDTGVLGEGTEVFVTYAYDPFLAEYNRDGAYPPNIISASARLAGAFTWDYLAGYVLADSKLRVSGETLEPVPQRDVMMVMKKRLIEEAKQDVAEFGFGFGGGVF